MEHEQNSYKFFKSIIGAVGDKATVNQNIFQESPKPNPYLFPRDLEDFTGRDDYIKTLMEHLQKGEITAISAVDGMGGVGKSALAIHQTRGRPDP